MKIEFTRAWCERMARREIAAGLSDIEAGGMPAGNPPEAFLTGSPVSMPLQATHRTQGIEKLARQQPEKR